MSKTYTYETNENRKVVIEPKDAHGKGGFAIIFSGKKFVLNETVAKFHKLTVEELKGKIEGHGSFDKKFWAA